ncbi:hypothetical protein DYD21_05550 [Rhodohalobacter sp. SW132]|uniref:ABC transporter substrate-binding protein n=1 Tax=Rhodohalobacter sp. SW132 TaxID=2293433 RepID=UPI000E271A00|nr:ABC transporter substrate-binding protein [Rhodohalobacter sp. SW132]REL38079.1 hypothetical protein DYD21_05550 [Rhodohalobacter sp. SW132]
MKYFTLLFFAFFATAHLVIAQDFDEALQLYEEGNFEEAAQIFSELNDDRAVLFTGKSYFGMQNYARANEYLKHVAENSTEANYRQEAAYTIALSHFRMKHYAQSLDQLHDLITGDERGRIRVDSQRFYRQILRYLSAEERFQVLNQTRNTDVAGDVVRSSWDYVSHNEYNALKNAFLNRITDSERYESLREELTREPRVESMQRNYPTPPEGMVYNIGVILPASEERSADMMVPRNLFYGITIAAEEFNSQHSDKKIFLKFKNSHRHADSTANAFRDLVLNGHVDAVIGPLFSEPARSMAELSEKYQVPMFAPLANSDQINLGYNYTYQMNPTFEVHGKRMARHAVQTLGLDTLAVISQKDALGTASARSFRHEAERLGAFISYYIEEDFASFGYDLSDFTKVFTRDPEEISEHNYMRTDGIYAPFTGQAANTLINLLMTDLEVLRSNMVIMGSEEWENTNLSSWQRQNFEVYYTQAFGTEADTSVVNFVRQDFETRFGIEPDQFGKIGYDVGTYLFNQISEAGNPAYLGEVIRASDRYQGLELSIDMNQNRINQSLHIRPLTDPARQRINR